MTMEGKVSRGEDKMSMPASSKDSISTESLETRVPCQCINQFLVEHDARRSEKIQ